MMRSCWMKSRWTTSFYYWTATATVGACLQLSRSSWWTPAPCFSASDSSSGPPRTCSSPCGQWPFASRSMYSVLSKGEAVLHVFLTHLQFGHNVRHHFFDKLLNVANKFVFNHRVWGWVPAMVPRSFLKAGFLVKLHVPVVDPWKVFAIIIWTIKNDAMQKRMKYPFS